MIASNDQCISRNKYLTVSGDFLSVHGELDSATATSLYLIVCCTLF